MQRTFIVGTRKPVALGLRTTTPNNAPSTTTGNMFYVVSKGFAGRLQGYTSNKSKTGNGTLYAVFATRTQATAHIAKNNMRLYASVVSV